LARKLGDTVEENAAAPMPAETPADRLRKERNRIRAAEIARSPSEIFWAGGNSALDSGGDIGLTIPLNNGPRPVGSPAVRVSGGWSDGLSRTREKRQIPILPSNKYPFKTIFYGQDPSNPSQYPTYLGGDRPPQTITTDPVSRHLANFGKKADWGISLGLGGGRLKFIGPQGEALNLTVASPAGNVQPKGSNFWLGDTPPQPAINIAARRIISGTPPFLDDLTSPINLSTGTSSAYNFSLIRDETATLSGANWAPYNAGSLNIGGETWAVTTTYNGTAQNVPSQYLWQTLARAETRGGDRRYPLRAFSYGPNSVDPVPGALGEGQRLRSGLRSASSTRAQDFSSYSANETISDQNLSKQSILVPIIGGQSLEYKSESSLTINSTMSDSRSVEGGTTATYTFHQESNAVNFASNPLKKLLIGRGAALSISEDSGSTVTSITDETKNITSVIRTTVTRPSMQNPILVSTTDYLVSAVRSATGALGGWYSGGSFSPGVPGEPPPANEKNYREGNLFPSEDVPQLAGNLPDPNNYYLPYSCRYAFYDARSAYGDNRTSSEVFCEYTYQEAKSIKGDIYDLVLGWSADFNWSYNWNRTITTVNTSHPPTIRKILTETETVEIPEQQTFSFYIEPEKVSAPTGAGVLTISSATTIVSILTSRFQETRTVEVFTRNYANNGNTPTVGTVTENVTYTCKDLSIIGKKAEVFRKTNGVITRWRGTIQSYAGDAPIYTPPTSSVISPTLTRTTTTIGPYPQTIAVKNLAIAVTEVDVVPFTFWGTSDGFTTVVLNPDAAWIHFVDYRFSNLVAGTEDSLAKLYVTARFQYVPGSVNYAAVWEFMRSGEVVMREEVKGKTKGDGAIVVGALEGALYFPSQK